MSDFPNAVRTDLRKPVAAEPGKSWSYAALTAALERELAIYEEASAKDDAAAKEHFRQCAHGAFDLWNTLTMGWQADGDKARLRARVRALHPRPHEAGSEDV